MADITIAIRRNTRPLITKVLRDRRNDDNRSKRIDITNYAFQFMAKRLIEDADADALFDLAGTIVDPTKGIYAFQLTSEHTSFPPGGYFGEIRMWDDADQTKPPTDAITVDYLIQPPVDNQV